MSLTLLSAGSNARGQLGHSLDEDAHEFRPCQFLGSSLGALPGDETTRIIDVATGANHTLVLLEVQGDVEGNVDSMIPKRKRELWGCGDGRSGQLGRKYQESCKVHGADVFQRLDLPLQSELGMKPGRYEYKAIAAGWETSYVVLSSLDPSDGDACISFGSNDFGDLGVGDIGTDSKPDSKSKKLKNSKHDKKEIHQVTFDHLAVGSSPLGGLYIDSLAASQHHVVAVVRLGLTKLLVGWGAARHGQVGKPGGGPPKAATSIQKAAPFVSLPRVVMLGDTHDPFVSVSVGSQHTVALCSSGRLIGMGSNRKGQLNLEALRDVKASTCSWNGTFAIVSEKDGNMRIYGVGQDTHGQLGRGKSETDDVSQPHGVLFPEYGKGQRPHKLSCGTEHVLTLWVNEEHSEVWGWGWNEHGNLGLGNTNDVHEPTRLWPGKMANGIAVNVWTGSGTSWILCKDFGSSRIQK